MPIDKKTKSNKNKIENTENVGKLAKSIAYIIIHVGIIILVGTAEVVAVTVVAISLVVLSSRVILVVLLGSIVLLLLLLLLLLLRLLVVEGITALFDTIVELLVLSSVV
jgi:hypothetical protein